MRSKGYGGGTAAPLQHVDDGVFAAFNILVYCIYVQYCVGAIMQVKVVRMRDRGFEHDRRTLTHLPAQRGMLVILDVTNQGLRRMTKVARLMQGDDVRHELVDVHIVWANEGKFVLTGFERYLSSDNKPTDCAQSWLCSMDFEALPEVSLSKLRNVRPHS